MNIGTLKAITFLSFHRVASCEEPGFYCESSNDNGQEDPLALL